MTNTNNAYTVSSLSIATACASLTRVISVKYDYISAGSTKIEARESLLSLRAHQISILGAAQAIYDFVLLQSLILHIPMQVQSLSPRILAGARALCKRSRQLAPALSNPCCPAGVSASMLPKYLFDAACESFLSGITLPVYPARLKS